MLGPINKRAKPYHYLAVIFLAVFILSGCGKNVEKQVEKVNNSDSQQSVEELSNKVNELQTTIATQQLKINEQQKALDEQTAKNDAQQKETADIANSVAQKEKCDHMFDFEGYQMCRQDRYRSQAAFDADVKKLRSTGYTEKQINENKGYFEKCKKFLAEGC
jgi:hypothetical protein